MKKTTHTIAMLLLCGVECSPPSRCTLGNLSSASETCVDVDGSCSLSNLMRFTALLDVSIYETVNKNKNDLARRYYLLLDRLDEPE
jgi:hypothetical protein